MFMEAKYELIQLLREHFAPESVVPILQDADPSNTTTARKTWGYQLGPILQFTKR